MNSYEWMTSEQAKERFGLTFLLLMELANENKIDRREIISTSNGLSTFLFRVSDVRDYIENN